MAIWRKVIVSGSIAELANLSVDNNVNVTGSLNVGANQTINTAASSTQLSGSFSGSFQGALQSALTNQSQPNVVFYDTASGLFSYAMSSSLVAATASYVSSSNVDGPFGLNSILSASYAVTSSKVIGQGTGSFTGSFTGDGSGLTGLVSTLSITGSEGSGSVNLLTQGLNILGTAFEVETSASGQTITIGLPDSVSVSQSLQAGFLTVSGSAQFLGGATGSFTGSFSGVTNLPDLTEGLGIVPFIYDGSGVATVAVSGAADLTDNMIVKWDAVAGKFTTSSITNASNVTINSPGGVLIQQGGLYVTGSSVFHNDLNIQGNLTVQGTASFQNTTNLEIADQFILLNSGSNTFQDSGFIVNTGNTGNSGSAFFLETAGTTTGAPLYGRFAVAGAVLPDATTATADEYAVTTKIVNTAPSAAPSWGGTGLGQGNMHIDTSNGDIWIYS